MSIVFASSFGATDPMSNEIEAEEAARKGEVVAQEVEAAEQLVVVRDQRLVFVEADLPDHLGPAGGDDRIPECVEGPEVDASAMREELLVQGDCVRLRAEQMKAQRLHPARRKSQIGTRLRLFVGRLVFESRGGPHSELQTETGDAFGACARDQSLHGGGAGQIVRLDDVERPQGNRRGQGKSAGDAALGLAKCRVEIGAAPDRAPLAQRRIAVFRTCLHQYEGWGRRQIMRGQLIDQVRGEIGELMLELELHSGGQKRRAFEQPADHRVDVVFEQPAQTLGDPGIFLSEFGPLFSKDREFLIIELEEFPIHRLKPIDLHLARVQFQFRDELHRDVYRLKSQLGADQEPHAQFLGRHCLVATGLDRLRREPRLEVA